MRILGIDPGTAIIGFGLVETVKNRIQMVDYGVVRPTPGLDLATRTLFIHQQISTLIKKLQPDRAAIEKLFFFKNAKTVISVSEARGVLVLALAQAGLPVFEYTPLQIKQAVSSYGRADKTQVQEMVKLILGLKTVPQPDDAADALAVAICCANSERTS